jgi:GT2 family glycosyltransferase
MALNFGVVLIRRELLIDEPFDERFGLCGNYEDIDWCLRMRKRGMVLPYVPQSEVIHLGAQTQAVHVEYGRQSVEVNRQKFVEKWKDEDPELFGLKEENSDTEPDTTAAEPEPE